MRFHCVISRNTADLFAQDGRDKWAAWKGLLAWLYSRDGLMRALLRGVFTYMKPGFHSWELDDRPLLQEALRLLEAGKVKELAAGSERCYFTPPRPSRPLPPAPTSPASPRRAQRDGPGSWNGKPPLRG